MSLDRDIGTICECLVEALRGRGLAARLHTGKLGMPVPGGVLRIGLTRGTVYVGVREAVRLVPGMRPGGKHVVWDGTLRVRTDRKTFQPEGWLVDLDYDAICDAVIEDEQRHKREKP